MLWLKSASLGRVIAYRKVLRVQQDLLSGFVNHAGVQYEVEELQRRQAGIGQRWKVVHAAQGGYTLGPMKSFGRVMGEQLAWADMPGEFCRHDLSIQTFCAAS